MEFHCEAHTDPIQAQQATSEEEITVNNQLCSNPSSGYLNQIRADFTNCALPSNSLSGACITGEQNEPNNCGYSTNLQGLCGYCASSSPNATDSCCIGSNVNNRCQGVTLPTLSSMPPLFPSTTATSTPSATAAPAKANKGSGLSGGAIAGIVVGSVIGAILLLGLILLCCICLRRRRRERQTNVFNQPTPPRRSGPTMAFAPQAGNQELPPDYGPQPGGRVARMSALEGNSSDNAAYGAAVAGGAARGTNKRYGDTSGSEGYYEDTPESRKQTAPAAGRRNGSLSSQSVLGALDDPSSNTDGQLSSPEGVTSGQSEQLTFFKDYYSEDEIHPNDKVATLWAYQPRAGDEFELERGDMLKVVGIWDDGWATGVRLNERAEDYDGKHKAQRDSGVSNGSGRDSPPPSGELKAFPVNIPCDQFLVSRLTRTSWCAFVYPNTGSRRSKGMLRQTTERVVPHKDSAPKASFNTYRHTHFLLRFYELDTRRAHAIGSISGVQGFFLRQRKWRRVFGVSPGRAAVACHQCSGWASCLFTRILLYPQYVAYDSEQFL